MEESIYAQAFPQSQQKEVHIFPFHIGDFDIMPKENKESEKKETGARTAGRKPTVPRGAEVPMIPQTVYSVAVAFNLEYLLLGHHNAFTIIDIAARTHHVYELKDLKQIIVTAIGISYFNHTIALGTQNGDCWLYQMYSYGQLLHISEQPLHLVSAMPNSVKEIYFTNADIMILVSLSCIRIFSIDAFKFDGELEVQLETQHFREVLQPLGISASTYDHEENRLLVALGDCSIQVYQFQGIPFDQLFSQSQVFSIQPMEIINLIVASDDGRLLAVAQCNLFESGSYKIDILDLKRRGKVIRSFQFSDGSEVEEMKFIPLQNSLLVKLTSMVGYVLNFDRKGDLEKDHCFTDARKFKRLVPVNKNSVYPNFLLVSEDGLISQLVFDTPKPDRLLFVPYMYFVELRLAETTQYKPQILQYFQTAIQQGFSGSEAKQAQQILLIGEHYFEPVYETVLRTTEFKEHYLQKYKYNARKAWKRKKIELPLWLGAWAIRAARMKSDGLDQIPEPPKLERGTKSQPKTTQAQKVRNRAKMCMASEESSETVILRTLGINFDIMLKQHNEGQVIDERFSIFYKLIAQMPYQNLIMMNFAHCALLFDQLLPFKALIFQVINKVDKLTYLDLSYTNLKIHDIRLLTRLDNLRYLDLSGNHIGNQEKRPLERKRMNLKQLQQNIDNEELMDIIDIIEELFLKIQFLNLRDNHFSDAEGAEILDLLPRKDILRVLDISGNLDFKEATQATLQKLITTEELGCLTKGLTLIIEFNDTVSDLAMKLLTRDYITFFNKMTQENPNTEQKPKQAIDDQFYLYIVNSSQNYDWDESLLQLYAQGDQDQNDEIRIFFFAFCQVYIDLFLSWYRNIRDNFIPCLKQCFCTAFFLQKYIMCCYCVFLQSDYGSWITKLLGIKTADYEYNDKKNDLKRRLEDTRVLLNVLFWLNFLIFYTVCIFVPIYFVLECQGHEWVGHFIYAGYAFSVFFLELYLSITCIEFKITHAEFSTGPLWRRALFFFKDILLSQMAKFDVYSDICFITTVMKCGDNLAIGWIAIFIMILSMGTTAYNVLKLLLSRQGGDENYIDYLCNYCSFLEINLVGSLLEKWTIQNTSNFLWLRAIPNRVYAATFRTFAEDIPQFGLQVAYILANPEKSEIEILMLSLASSTVSTLISITKSITITKANRIDDKIMMKEVKTKLSLNKEVEKPEFNEQLIQFLHDYYDTFDGTGDADQQDMPLRDFKLSKLQKSTLENYRNIKRQRQLGIPKRGFSMLEEDRPQLHKGPTKRGTALEKDEAMLDLFEPYIYLIHSQQAKIVRRLWGTEIKQPEIAQTLLELEILDFTGVDVESEKQVFHFAEGSFIESLSVQAKILDTMFDYLKRKKDENISILDVGCGYSFTASLIIKLCEKIKKPKTYKILCVDHISSILSAATSINQLSNKDYLEDETISFMLHDCKQNMDRFGKFDIINFGFALASFGPVYRLMNEDAIAICPYAFLPQDHNYSKLTSARNHIEEKPIHLSAQSGQLLCKELQSPEQYSYFQVKRGQDCELCKNQVQGKDQFYSPWLDKHYCLACSSLDDANQDQNTFKIVSNLVFIPANATDEEMNRVSTYKFGKNIFPKREQKGNKYHPINCSPCQREASEVKDFDPLPRYICLNCRPGKFDGQHLDLCNDCAKGYFTEEGRLKNQYKLHYLPGHFDKHLLLKIHFYNSYAEY